MDCDYKHRTREFLRRHYESSLCGWLCQIVFCEIYYVQGLSFLATRYCVVAKNALAGQFLLKSNTSNTSAYTKEIIVILHMGIINTLNLNRHTLNQEEHEVLVTSHTLV